MPYLYQPPTWKNRQVMEGSLRYYVDSSTTTYRLGGVWHNVQTPGQDSPVVASVDVDPSGLKLYFNTPTTIPNSLQPELAAFGVGTLTLL